MNLAEYSIRKNVVTITLAILVVVAGIFAYLKMSRLEDPEFTIKQALVVTSYPGASAQEVSEEVTEKLEKAIQQLGQLRRVTSRSTRGLSIITVVIKDKYDKSTLPQVWDELRRKVSDAQRQLPLNARPSVIYDDYSDVYGMFYAVTGDGYSYAELKNVTKFLQRELLRCKDVKKIELWGERDEAVYVQISREKIAALGISPTQIFQLLAQKNLVGNAGNVKVGPEYISITPTGNISEFEDLGKFLISKDKDKLIYLSDIAEIKRGYIDPPSHVLTFNGKKAIGIAASTVLGGDAVKMGNDLQKRLKELKGELPAGIEVHPISLQSETVTKAVSGFVLNVFESLIIVIVVLLVFMGLRSGLLIGIVLLVTIAGTLAAMKYYCISLERISLGALILALGMLVDNAIVVTEGMMVKIQKGEDKLQAAKEVVSQNQWPLLGATAISILAFAAIGTSQDSSGEFCGSLFKVMLISLTLSWITAVTLTPLLCFLSFKSKSNNGVAHDPYGGLLFRLYRRSLELCLYHRKLTVATMLVLLVLGIIGLNYVDKTFFPPSDRTQFMIELWLPEGTHITETEALAARVENIVRNAHHVKDIATFAGGGATRFYLSYAPEKDDSSYAILIISVDDGNAVEDLVSGLQKKISDTTENCLVNVKKFQQGPGEGGKIQTRISGRDPDVLRRLSDKVVTIMKNTPNTKAVLSDWRNKVKTVKPLFSEDQARRQGISHQELCNGILENFDGLTIGYFRENDERLPVIARAPDEVHGNISTLDYIFLWSDFSQKMIPIGQVVSNTGTVWENPIVMRRHRLPTVTVHCDPEKGIAEPLFRQLRTKIESIEFPDGYFIEWGGEYEDTNDAQASLNGGIPFFMVMMVLMVVCLFNSIRHTLVIWLTVPLALIGVAAGLLLFGQPFGFMALLGFLSLSGMQIKNGIVLLDEINCQRALGEKTPWHTVVDSAISRIRPVSMAAFTTILGMAPLLKDNFFAAMAVTIMFGLSFACVLTLYVVPVLYSILFKVKPQ